MFSYRSSDVHGPLKAALESIAEDFPIRGATKPGRAALRLSVEGRGCRIGHEAGRTVVTGGTIPQLMRGLSMLRGWQREGRSIPSRWEQLPRLDMIGLMLDVSRNAVPRVETIKYLLRRMALMGMNTLLLYMEDTYEVPSQPYIGYLRGRYTQADLREIDRYAAVLGMDVVPCIQTLAHLGQMLRWHVFDDVRDTPDILLVDEPKTYALLEQMIAAASSPFRSRRIHIGMDEAHDLGLGKYRQLHGVRSGFEIIGSHLKQIMSITRRLNLQPMIWSDMYFRLGSARGDYYDPAWKIPPRVAKQIPRDLQLVYWDYYHADPADYTRCIANHRSLGGDPVFAGGLWTWSVLWQNFTKARINTNVAMSACKAAGLREAFTTAWGDDGAEVDLLAMLPGLQHFAEHAYRDEVDDAALSIGFHGSADADWKSWSAPAAIDMPPGLASMKDVNLESPKPSSRAVFALERSRTSNLAMANPAKYLLWQDPLLGLFDAHTDGLPLSRYYRQLHSRLKSHAKAGGSIRRRLAMPIALSRVLSQKAEFGTRLRRAYGHDDRAQLKYIVNELIPALLVDVASLHRRHRGMWMKLNRANGWETIESRYATLRERLITTRIRLRDFVSGRIDRIEELDEARLPVLNWPQGKLGQVDWPARRIMTPSIIP